VQAASRWDIEARSGWEARSPHGQLQMVPDIMVFKNEVRMHTTKVIQEMASNMSGASISVLEVRYIVAEDVWKQKVFQLGMGPAR